MKKILAAAIGILLFSCSTKINSRWQSPTAIPQKYKILVQEQTKYFLECNFYRVDNKELLYSAQTVSFESGSVSTLAHQ